MQDLFEGFAGGQREYQRLLGDILYLGDHLPSCPLVRARVVVGNHDRYTACNRLLNGPLGMGHGRPPGASASRLRLWPVGSRRAGPITSISFSIVWSAATSATSCWRICLR